MTEEPIMHVQSISTDAIKVRLSLLGDVHGGLNAMLLEDGCSIEAGAMLRLLNDINEVEAMIREYEDMLKKAKEETRCQT